MSSNVRFASTVTVQKKATIHQVTTVLAASRNVLFPGHNHLLTTGTDDLTLAGARAIIKASGYQYQWLAGGYDLQGNKTFLEVASTVITWWIVFCFCAVCVCFNLCVV